MIEKRVLQPPCAKPRHDGAIAAVVLRNWSRGSGCWFPWLRCRLLYTLRLLHREGKGYVCGFGVSEVGRAGDGTGLAHGGD